MSELVDEKAARLVAQDRVHITQRSAGVTVALVHGDTKSWKVTRSDDGDFEGCECPSVHRCSHIEALRLVTAGDYDEEETMAMDETQTVDDGPQEVVEAFEAGTQPPEDREPVEIAPTPSSNTPETIEAALLPLSDASASPVTFQTLRAISKTEFVPQSLRGKPEAILAAVLFGREMGLGPMAALSHISIIEGRPSPSAELLSRMIRAAGHQIEVLEASTAACQLRGTRADTGETLEVTYSIADAERAGLVSLEDGVPRARSSNGKPLPWEKYTADLLWARAISRLHRRLFSDVTRLPEDP